MAAMASKFNFECVIQYYTDQWGQLQIDAQSSGQTEKFYFVHKRSFSPENFAQKCRKRLQIIMSLIRWSGFTLVDDPRLSE